MILAVPRPDPTQALRVWRRHVLTWLRFWRTSILINFIDPIAALLALGVGIGSYIKTGVDGVSFMQFIAPGLVAMTSMNSVSFDCLWTTYNNLYDNKVYPSMITTPATVDDLVAGTLLWQATRSFVYGGIFLIIITAFGLVHHWTALLTLPVLIVSGIMFAAPAVAYVALAKAVDHMLYYISLVIIPMYFFGGVFFPISRLPHPVREAVWFTPLYHVAHLCRQLVLGRVSADLWLDLAWIVVFTAILLLLPVRLISRKLLV
jgi:lipooligosaccharide transport system permease protein